MRVWTRAREAGIALGLTLGLWGCTPEAEARGAAMDLAPPGLLSGAATAPGSVEILFTEPVSLTAGSLVCDPPLDLSASRSQGDSLLLDLGPQVPGTRYLLELTVADLRGNGATILVAIYGYNPELPSLLINELTVRGSAAHPDLVELRVTSAGNMGGLVLYDGTPGNWTSRIVFPAVRVREGEFVLAHFRPEGIAAEIDEIADRTASGGLDSSPAAWDFWVPDSTGLNGNNGVISLYRRVGGEVADAIVYSNRTSESDATYGGFGTADTLARVTEIAAAGGWQAAGSAIRPEDAVNPELSTSTRSLCRRRGIDSDSLGDWYIVPTRGATFGGENLEEEYRP